MVSRSYSADLISDTSLHRITCDSTISKQNLHNNISNYAVYNRMSLRRSCEMSGGNFNKARLFV